MREFATMIPLLTTPTLRSYKDNNLPPNFDFKINSNYCRDSDSIDLELDLGDSKFKFCTSTQSGFYFYLNNVFNEFSNYVDEELLSYLHKLFVIELDLPGDFIFNRNLNICYFRFNSYSKSSSRLINLKLPFFIDNKRNIHTFHFCLYREQKNWLKLLLIEQLNYIYKHDKKEIKHMEYYAIVRVDMKGRLVLSSFVFNYDEVKFRFCLSVKKEVGISEIIDGYNRSKKVLNKYCTGLSVNEAQKKFLIKLDLKDFYQFLGESQLTLFSEMAKYE